MTTSNREVVYTLRAEFDEAGSRQAIDRMTKVMTMAEEAKRKEDKKTQDEVSRGLDRAAKAQERAAEKAEREARRAEAEEQKRQNRIFTNRTKLLDRMARDKRRVEAQELADTKRAVDQAERLQAQSMEKIQNLGEKFKGSLAQGAEGFMKMARGAAVLGVAGEKDLQKLLEALAKIQAAFDIARGAMDVYFALANGVKAYRDAVLAAKVAEDALAIARARSAAAGGAAGAGGAAAGAGGAAAGAGGMMAGAGLLGVGASTAAAATAAAAGVGLAGYSAYDVATHDPNRPSAWMQFNANLQSTHLNIADRIFGTSVGADFERNYMMTEERTRADVQGGQAMALEAERAANEIRKMAQAASEASITMNRIGGILAMGALPGEDRMASVGEAERMVSTRQTEIRSELSNREGMSIDQQQALMQEQTDLAQTQVQLANERLRIEQDIYQTKKQEATESLRAMETELEQVKRIQQIEQERLMTAKERFGAMTEEEQARVIAAKKRADEVGAENLTREELQLLQSVGLTSTTGIASRGYQARAEAGGFPSLVTAEDTAAAEAAAARERELNVQIEDQREILVQIDADYERVEEELVKKIKEAFAAQQQAFEAAARGAVDAAMMQYRNEQNQRAIAAQQARQ